MSREEVAKMTSEEIQESLFALRDRMSKDYYTDYCGASSALWDSLAALIQRAREIGYQFQM